MLRGWHRLMSCLPSTPQQPLSSSPARSCANLDVQILARLPTLLSGDASGALALARHYLLGEGSLEGALEAAMGLDVPGLQRRINETRGALLQSIVRLRGTAAVLGQAAVPTGSASLAPCLIDHTHPLCLPDRLHWQEGDYDLQPLLAAPLDSAVALSYSMQEGLDSMLGLLRRDEVLPGALEGAACALLTSCMLAIPHFCSATPPHALSRTVYVNVKAFACCRTLDLAGRLWLALLLASSCALAACALAMLLLASLEKLGKVKKG